MDFGAPIGLLQGFFESEGERWAVVGGVALLAYGIERATFDVDILVASTLRGRLIGFLAGSGETLVELSCCAVGSDARRPSRMAMRAIVERRQRGRRAQCVASRGTPQQPNGRGRLRPLATRALLNNATGAPASRGALPASRSRHQEPQMPALSPREFHHGLLEENGYQTIHRSQGYSNHIHSDSAVSRLDVVYVEPMTTEKIFLDGQEKTILDRWKIVVPKPEHLVAMKVRAIKNDPSRRLQDLADIRQLARLPKTDLQEIRGYFQEVGLASMFGEIDR